MAESPAPPITKFNIAIEGTGARNNTTLEMISGGKKSHKTRANGQGDFKFPILSYNPKQSLNLMFSIVGGTSNAIPANILNVTYNPFRGTADITGTASPNSLIVGNISAEDSFTAIANDDGRFSLRLSSTRGINDEGSKLAISIVNIQSQCCPKAYLPSTPIVLIIKTIDLTPNTPEQKSDIQKSESQFSYAVTTDITNYGVSVPQEKLEASWLKAIRLWEISFQKYIMGSRNALNGGFIDAQSNLTSLLSRAKQTADVTLNHTVSEGVCSAASVSQSLGKADTKRIAEQLAISKILMDRDLGKPGSVYFDNNQVNMTAGLQGRLTVFKDRFCDKADENSSLSSICKTRTDVKLNRDIDFTRGLDVPLTLKVNFAETPAILNDDETDILALAENLFPSQLLSTIENNRDNFEENYTDFRSLLASRSIARNSFASIVAEAESVGKSTPFAKNAVKAIMKTPADVDKLLGANPSYFAQMEVLTKKLYQSPDFIKNLMTNDTNVTRSRVAMKAVDLQQNQDLLNSLYRREMLLATYLEQMINDSRARTNIDKRSMEN
jgi:hypothetical protein